MGKNEIIAFFSYARDNNIDDRITPLYKKLEIEVNNIVGDNFSIFFDNKSISPGEKYPKIIKDNLNKASVFIAIITPKYFQSDYCRYEIETFLERTKNLDIDGLIHPILYVDCLKELNDKFNDDPLFKEIAKLQHTIWHPLRHEDYEHRDVRKKIGEIADNINKILLKLETSSIGKQCIADDTKNSDIEDKTSQQISKEAVIFYRTDTSDATNDLLSNKEIVDGLTSQNSFDNELTDHDIKGEESKPRIINVSMDGNQNFKSISEAIQSSSRDDTIIVHPGTYKESLLIDKSINIEGKGNNADFIIIESNDNCTLISNAFNAELRYVTLRYTGNDSSPCIKIKDGNISINNCNVESENTNAIELYSQAEPILSNNHIRKSGGSGVVLSDGAQGLLDGNYIYKNSKNGILIMKGASSSNISFNYISENGFGIYVDKGTGYLEDNRIFDNISSGIMINNYGNLTLLNNNIYNNKNGIELTDNSICEIDKCILSKNQIGVSVTDKSKITIGSDTKICNNNKGILISIIGTGDVKNSFIENNSDCGISIEKTSHANIEANTIRGNGNGIKIIENSFGQLISNTIIDNQNEGIIISTGAYPLVKNNTIEDNKTDGLLLENEAMGTICENKILNNERNGLIVKSNSSPVIKTNKILNNKASGIAITDNGLGLFNNNRIESNQAYGVEILSGSNPTLLNNGICDNTKGGVFINNEGMGLIRKNNIFNNIKFGVMICDQSNPTIIDNNIYENREDGIRIDNQGLGRLKNNHIYVNKSNGVTISGMSRPELNHNVINNNKNGVCVEANGNGTLDSNKITDNTENGVLIDKDSNPFMYNNEISSNKQNGITIRNNGQGMLENNTISNNRYNGIFIELNAHPVIKKNSITHNLKDGIQLKKNGQGIIEHNTISGHQTGISYASDDGDLVFSVMKKMIN